MLFPTRRAFVSVVVFALAAAPMAAQQEIDNVAAFARLYGVTRWFYPGDAAATLDWNRFAVDGVRRVRSARNTAELETTLKQLFTPVGPGIEIGSTLSALRPAGRRNAALVAWHYRGPGITAGISGPYSGKRMNRSMPVPAGLQNLSFNMMQLISADTLRGKTVRLRGHMRVANRDAQSTAGLWLRVDRGEQGMGFFDNMRDRPVMDTAWREYVIQGPIADDATRIAFGVLSSGSMTVDIDGIEVAVRNAGGDWIPLAIADAGFEQTAPGTTPGWIQSSATAFSRPSNGAVEGTRFVRIAPTAPKQSPPAQPIDSLETPIAGASIDIDLASGLKARVPLSLTDAEARTELPALATLRAALAQAAASASRDDADTRLADAVVAWNVFRHFYPYWGDVNVNWDARLRPQLEIALRSAPTRDAHLEVVRMMVAELKDGHGSVRDAASTQRISLLPLQFRILAGQLVVTASSVASVPVGSVVTTINGLPASGRIETETQLASGTPQWKRTRAESALQQCQVDATVTLTIEPPTGAARDATLPCTRGVTRTAETRPDSIAELQPGIWYVDLTRVQATQLDAIIATLVKARGVVFDLRGYPTDIGSEVLTHLMRTAENATDRWMHVPRFAAPFAKVAAWQDASWNLQPMAPLIAGQRIFLTDGRAISYAESVMGYVRDYKLATIIGGTTAGANGNVANFTIPGGFAISFTGMRVTRHDGTTPYHTVGVSPDIAIEPTLAGIRAGRDEVLERALVTLRRQP